MTVPDLEPVEQWDGNDYEEYDDGGSDYDTYDSDAYSQSDGNYDDNPYAAPGSGSPKRSGRSSTSSRISPTQVEVGDILNHSVEVWKKHLGVLVGAFVIILAVSFAFSMISGVIQALMGGGGGQQFGQQQFGQPQPQEPIVVMVGLFFSLISWLVQTYLTIGQARMSLAAARGQTPEIGMLFNGGKWFFPIVLTSILFGIALFFGLLLLIVPGILLALYFWPFYYLIVDDKAQAMESFEVAKSFAGINKGTSFLMYLLNAAIMLLGALACCVGIIFAGPLAAVTMATAYLMMSGQLRTGRR